MVLFLLEQSTDQGDINPNSQMVKVRLKKAESLTQGHAICTRRWETEPERASCLLN